MVEVTKELLNQGRGWRGGWNRQQFQLLGLAWPPPAGWRDLVMGRQIADQAAERFVELRDARHFAGRGHSNLILGMLH